MSSGHRPSTWRGVAVKLGGSGERGQWREVLGGFYAAAKAEGSQLRVREMSVDGGSK